MGLLSTCKMDGGTSPSPDTVWMHGGGYDITIYTVSELSEGISIKCRYHNTIPSYELLMVTPLELLALKTLPLDGP